MSQVKFGQYANTSRIAMYAHEPDYTMTFVKNNMTSKKHNMTPVNNQKTPRNHNEPHSTQPQLKEQLQWQLPPEYARQAAVLIAWPHQQTDWAELLQEAEHNFAELIAAISLVATPWILVPDIKMQAAIETMVLQAYSAQGWQQHFELAFSACRYDDTWTRDFGPLCVFKASRQVGEKHLRIQNFTFNGWGQRYASQQDNSVNQQLWDSGEFQRVYLHQLEQEKLSSVQFQTDGLVLEGGSLETNGHQLLTTAQCLQNTNRNPTLSQLDLEHILKAQFGVEDVIWLTHGHLEGDDTDAHIDTLARFINADTLIFQGCQNQQDSHYPAFQKMQQQLTIIAQKYNFKLLELPWPQAQYDQGRRLPATYANFLLLNGALLLPTYCCPQDTQAIQLIKQACPELEVIPVNCQTLIRNNGSLHCSTLQLPHIWSRP